ncbi:hypothetical protein Lfu02_53260 [Longispora fulva]|uniref:Uncharacterized protein n=1 Tax=Longispora fulva TaxID=619741 RepID=A0A8J7GP44_9ACTN|nr:hypothetical protein [Longispora fulva]MBG6140782.1 hypothetical protein [Longispora fulva]GIG60954.1 hypothetical protein Lfu02_53260 [Longispora fulva]
MTTPQYGPGGWQPPQDGAPQPGYDPNYGQPPVQYDQPYSAPGYDPNYGQQQPGYDQYAQPGYDQPQTGYEQQPQPGYDPNYGYAPQMSAPPMSGPPVTGGPAYSAYGPPMTPPAAKSSKTGWIIGGIVIGAVVLLMCGIGAYVVVNKSDAGGTGGLTGSGGKYKAVANLCDKVSTTDAQSVLGTPDGAPTFRTSDYSSIGYTTLSCQLMFKSGTNSSSLGIEVKVTKDTSKAKSSYDSSKKYDDGQTESGRVQSAVTDLGEQAYQVVTKKDYSSFKSVTYEVNVQDSNLVIEMRMHGTFNTYDEAQLTQKLKDLTKATMASLKA